MPRDYLVIVYPPPPATRGMASSSTETLAVPARVVEVKRVSSPQAAADGANVDPGGRCIVVTDSRNFTRAAIAPLEETGNRWEPLPQAAEPGDERG